jgi:hypothetical protein
MNALLPRFLKSAYRKEPISSFVILIGAVDAVIGGMDGRWSLLTFGLGTVGVAIALRWWQIQQRQIDLTEQSPQYFLPPTSSRPALPVLSAAKRQPPR